MFVARMSYVTLVAEGSWQLLCGLEEQRHRELWPHALVVTFPAHDEQLDY